MRFELGQVVATPAALTALGRAGANAHELLQRHVELDPGILSAHDQRANEAALADGSRIFSSFRLSDGTKVWVITEAVGDNGRRASTCVLLPEDY